MNQVLKNVLKIAEEIGKNAVPGGQLIDSGVHAVIDHKVNEGLLDTVSGALQLIENVKGVDVVDDALFREGVMSLEIGFAKVKASLKQS